MSAHYYNDGALSLIMSAHELPKTPVSLILKHAAADGGRMSARWELRPNQVEEAADTFERIYMLDGEADDAFHLPRAVTPNGATTVIYVPASQWVSSTLGEDYVGALRIFGKPGSLCDIPLTVEQIATILIALREKAQVVKATHSTDSSPAKRPEPTPYEVEVVECTDCLAFYVKLTYRPTPTTGLDLEFTIDAKDAEDAAHTFAGWASHLNRLPLKVNRLGGGTMTLAWAAENPYEVLGLLTVDIDDDVPLSGSLPLPTDTLQAVADAIRIVAHLPE